MKKRCKYSKLSKEGRERYQVRCPKEAKKKGYCIEHYALRQRELSSKSLENPSPLTKHISRGISNQEKFSKKFGKRGKIKIKEKIKKVI